MPVKNYKQVKVNFTYDDYMRIARIAEAEEVTIAQLIRSRFDASIENAPDKRKRISYKSTDPKLIYELNKIGNNLNQIAKRLNSTGEFDRTVLLQIYNMVMSLK